MASHSKLNIGSRISPGGYRWLVCRAPASHRNLGGGSGAAIPQDGRNPSVTPNCRILVIDDNKDSADSLAMLLSFLGADVQVVYDGQTALERLAISRPSVLFLDIGMPGLNGYEVAERVRQDRQFCNVVLVALTGWGQEERSESHARRWF